MKILVVSQADLQFGFGSDFEPEDQLGMIEAGKHKSKRVMIIEHNNEKLSWNFPPRTWNTEPDSNALAFDQINAYFATLSQEKQDALFEHYKEISNVLSSTTMQQDECEDLIEAIRPLAENLFNEIDPQHFYNWVWTTLRPRIPADVKAAFDPDTMPGTRERTYLLEDYRGLIPLSIIVRMAVPFWFHFIALTKSVLSKEHRDMLTYSLIGKTWVAQCQAMKRLEVFTDHTIGNDRNNPIATLLAIGTDDFVYWALSSLVINRLPVVDVMGQNSLTPVVSALYNYVRHRVTTMAQSHPAIKNKFADTSYSADENNQSYLEGFRNRIALTVGQEALGDQYLERQIEMIHAGRVDPLSLIERVAPGIDYELVKDSMQSARALYNVALVDEQITIAAWLFHPYSQVRTVGNLRKERVVALLGMAQAVLLHHQKPDLALLTTAAYTRVDDSGGTHYIGETIAPLRAPDREAYRAVFPLEQRSRNQKKVRNFVFEDVYELVRSLQEYDIRCSFSDDTLRKVQGNNPNRMYHLRKDAVTMFMEYAKWLALRPMVRIDPDQVYQNLVAAGRLDDLPDFKPYQYQHQR